MGREESVERKIMIHSEQIPTLFLADKILEVAGNVYRETWKKKEEEEEGRKIHGGEAWYVALSICAVTEGKV